MYESYLKSNIQRTKSVSVFLKWFIYLIVIVFLPLEEEEVEFNVGESEVLQALDLVLPLMSLGETSLVEVSVVFID